MSYMTKIQSYYPITANDKNLIDKVKARLEKLHTVRWERPYPNQGIAVIKLDGGYILRRVDGASGLLGFFLYHGDNDELAKFSKDEAKELNDFIDKHSAGMKNKKLLDF